MPNTNTKFLIPRDTRASCRLAPSLALSDVAAACTLGNKPWEANGVLNGKLQFIRIG